MKTFDVYPLFDIEPVKAEGSWLWDNKGQRYLDLYGGHAVISIGHSHPHYLQKIKEQLDRIAFYSNSVKIQLQEELAMKLGELSGYPDYSLFLCNSGAEANENAFKLASFHTGRKKIIAFKGSFHGRTSLAVAATDDPSIQAPVNANEQIEFVCLNDFDGLNKAIDQQTAAVIIEGIQGVGGVQVPTTEFLLKIRELCTQYGAMMILDEVQSGYGRSGKFFAHQHASIRPDLITMAKGMGNGFPVGGVLISPDFKAKHGLLGTTFGGNYLACAAAIAVLDVIKEENLLKQAALTGKHLMDSLENLQGIKAVRGYGLMIGVEFEHACAPIRKALLEKHHIFTGSSSDKNTLRILPALNLGRFEVDFFLKAIQQLAPVTNHN
ncbi:MAG: aminotransferase class III-fold pyridoxal phosphate-dependent enzyme [Bacteroidia bacterium]|jgi:acetylornithine/N-succinyldiaminopimelate aminotransferase|nr:aminotransferase class III-fold pyridoxal phosphate-dependent enzyme [Bacteroidia bacterium]MCC6768301.1 aminotransferase class III-fold pyridoxal phosphate-dependent enzyme [Bacteroidia bacterium]